MPIKKDGTGKRWVEMEVLVPGTPEQVWQAIATGPGNAAWFTRAEIEPRVGGALSFAFGQEAVSSGEVTVWEPPRELGYVEREWEQGAPPVATEVTITARSGGKCLLRMVHSLFTSSDDWDDQMEGFERGWAGFFAVLRVYLAHFAGAPAASFIAMTPTSSDVSSAWRQLGDALGVSGANVGQRRKLWSPSTPETGCVELIQQTADQRYILLRLEAPTPGIVLTGVFQKGESTHVSFCHFYYGPDAAARAAEDEPAWREWLTRTFTASSA